MPPTSKKAGPGTKKPTEMSLQQKLFVHYLLQDPKMDAGKAALQAGYATEVTGHALLKKNQFVIKAVREFLDKASVKTKVSAERILKEVDTLALRDIIDFCDENGQINMTDLRKIPETARRCIDSIKVKSGFDDQGNPIQICEIKLVPKLAALELAMKHRGMLDEVGMQKPESTDGKMSWDDLYEPPNLQADPVRQRLAIEQQTTEAATGAPFEAPNPVLSKKGKTT
jgi:hypothetical protein